MLAVPEANVEAVLEVFALWDVPATVVGRVIEEPVARVLYNGTRVLEMDLDFYTRGPEYCRPFLTDVAAETRSHAVPSEPTDYGRVLLDLLGRPNVASKELVIRQYDHEVQGATVVKPLQGVLGKACHGDASVLKPLEDSWRGLAIATASTPQFTRLHPFRGGAGAVDEVVRNLVAVGARPTALSDCLNFGNPEKPDRLGAFREAVRGIGHVATPLQLPIPSGNVSFYNETPLSPVPPTPVILGTGIVADIRRSVTSDLKAPGSLLYLVGETRAELGGSEYYALRGVADGTVPDVDPERLRRSADGLLRTMDEGLVRACHDPSHGGLAVAVAEMALGGELGIRLEVDPDGLRPDLFLFSESHTRWVVEVAPEHAEGFEALLDGVPLRRLGRVEGQDLHFRVGGTAFRVDLDGAREAWSNGLRRLVEG